MCHVDWLASTRIFTEPPRNRDLDHRRQQLVGTVHREIEAGVRCNPGGRGESIGFTDGFCVLEEIKHQFVLAHGVSCITTRASINMPLTDEAKPKQLTYVYTREWCNNLIPRWHAKKALKR